MRDLGAARLSRFIDTLSSSPNCIVMPVRRPLTDMAKVALIYQRFIYNMRAGDSHAVFSGASMTHTLLAWLRAAGLLLLFLGVGKLSVALLALPIPGSIVGLLLLFAALSTGWLPQRYLQPAGSMLLNYITLLFVPVGVGLIRYRELLASQGMVILISSLVSLALTLVIVGWCFQRLRR